jgi:Gas vesicle synthesis protein GvpL/GvpF
VIEVYAITDDDDPPLSVEAPLRAVIGRRLAAVCAPGEERPATAEALWRHEELVEALMEQRDLLPVRYGTRLENEDAVREVLDEREDELARALERVRGAVELAVRAIDVSSQPAPPEPAASGAEYLASRQQTAAAREAAVQVLHAPLSSSARASSTRTPGEAAEVLCAAYLVDRASVPDFVALVGRLQDENPALRIVCTGPWPPYSFTEA